MTKYDDLVVIVLSKIPRGGITCGELFESMLPHTDDEVQVIEILENLHLERKAVRFTPHPDAMAMIVTRTIPTPLDVAGNVLAHIPPHGISWQELLVGSGETAEDLILKLYSLFHIKAVEVEHYNFAENPFIWAVDEHDVVTPLNKKRRQQGDR